MTYKNEGNSRIIIFFIFTLLFITSCKKTENEELFNDAYKINFQTPSNEFGQISGIPKNIELQKYTILESTPYYSGGAAFASMTKISDTEFLAVSTGYTEYSDFAESDLIYINWSMESKQKTKQEIFQKNNAKIQIGGISLLKLDERTLLSFFNGVESKSEINIYMKKSNDLGLTWSPPERINTIQNQYQHIANSRAILLSTGRIVLPMSIGGTGTQNFVFCYYSDNNGISWKESRKFYIKNNELYEPCIEELPNGKLIMTLRNLSGKIIFAFSDDNGLIWKNFVYTKINSPDAPSFIAKIPGKDLLVLIWNNSTRIYDYQLRSPLSLAISKDNGENWEYLFDIENRLNIGAYYPTINFNNNKLLITYTQKDFGESKASVIYTEILIDELLKYITLDKK